MQRALLLILAVSTLLSLGFVLMTPVGGAPDEGAHLQYVRHLAQQGSLPALDLTKRRDPTNDPHYESHQPPLYYGLAVPFFMAGHAVGGETAEGQACRVLSVLIGLAATALIWALVRELAPDRPILALAATAFAAFLPMRLAVLASVSNDGLMELFCTLSLLLTVRAVRGPFGVRESALIGASVALAVLSKQSAVLLVPPVALGFLLAARRWGTGAAPSHPERVGEWGKGRMGAPASRAGRSDTRRTDRDAGAAPRSPSSPHPRTRTSGRPHSRSPIPPFSSTEVGGSGAAPSPETSTWLRDFARNASVAAGVFLVVAGWWFVRNFQLYGDPLGQKAFNWYFEDTPRWASFQLGGMTFLEYLRRLVFPVTFASFWGAFGHLDPKQPELFMGALPADAFGHYRYPPDSWVYPGLGLATLLALAGGVRYYLRWREAPSAHPGLLLVVLHAVFVFAAFLNFNTTYFQAQGRYLFPAMAVISMGMAGGWLEWARRREAVAAWIIAAGMALLAAYAVFGVLMPGFAAQRG